MSNHHHRRRHKKISGKSFIILPLIFLAGTYLLLYLVIAPSFGSITASLGHDFSDTKKDYSTEFDNIFVPVDEENNTIPTVSRNGNTYIKNDAVAYPSYGDLFGELTIEDCDVKAPLFFGNGDVALRNGVGVYKDSFVPGYGKTILVSGHNGTYFNGLKYAEKGQEVLLRTSYGNYRYKITDTAIKEFDDTAFDLKADYENLVMCTCYPFDTLGLTEQKFFVYAEFVSGTPIDKTIEEAE